MPIYEYFCPDCQATFEMQRRMAERDVETECPECRSGFATRQMSSFMMPGDWTATNGSGGCGACTPSPSGCAACGITR